MPGKGNVLQRLRFWIYWPGLYIYFRKGHRSRVLIHDGDKILLVKGRWKLWFGDDLWSLPGGGIRETEQPVEAAVRELNEELGLQITAGQLKPLSDRMISEHGLRYHAYFFELELSTTTELHLQPSEIAVAQWLESVNISTDSLKPEVQHALEVWRK